MKTFTVKISDDTMTAIELKNSIWQNKWELNQEDVTVEEIV